MTGHALTDPVEIGGLELPNRLQSRWFPREPGWNADLCRAVREAVDVPVLCESCNNCTIPQVAGEPGRCRTPRVVRERARLEREGDYGRDGE